MSASLLTLGTVAITSGDVGATSKVKTIPLTKETLNFHVAWTAETGGSSLSGTMGKFRIKAEVTQPQPYAANYVLQGTMDGLNLHIVLNEGFDASGFTITGKGSVGNKAVNVSGSLQESTSGSIVIVFTGKIGATKISGKSSLSTKSLTSASGVVKVS
jgi:hypothetical protein